jgi:hypothetical protein
MGANNTHKLKYNKYMNGLANNTHFRTTLDFLLGIIVIATANLFKIYTFLPTWEDTTRATILAMITGTTLYVLNKFLKALDIRIKNLYKKKTE